MDNKTHLILLRGNSGSGKTTSGKAIQKKFGRGTMLISQDVVRRDILYVADGPDPAADPLLAELACYGKEHCKIVILEGILNSRWYAKLFEDLINEFGDHIHAYYFDLPFEETVLRHQGKPNVQEFGESDMKRWWIEKDFLNNIAEKCITKDFSLNEIVDLVYQDVINSGYSE